MADQENGCGCKFGRVTRGYGTSIDDSRIADKWRNGTSVRELTDELNEEIIESELSAANVDQIGWNLSPIYEALHTDDVSEAEEIEIRRELDRAGVDPEQLSSDLVSHQTVYRHLTECLEASHSDDRTPDDRRENAKDTVHALQHRTEIVTESTLESLRAAGVTDLGETSVLVDIQVVCSDCGRSMSFDDAISNGCDCPS